MNFGKTIDSAVIEMGLRQLCPDIHFDCATKLGAWHPSQHLRQGVFWHGQHICSMDRGLVPEFKQWSVIENIVEVGWEEADKEDVSLQTKVIPPGGKEYLDAFVKIEAKVQGYEFRPDGAIIKYTPIARRKKQGKVVLVGWRHTFERILRRDLPGITRRSLAEKFAVDMLKYPVGAPSDVMAALVAE